MAHSHPPVDVGEFASLPTMPSQFLLITFSRLQIEKAELAQQLQLHVHVSWWNCLNCSHGMMSFVT